MKKQVVSVLLMTSLVSAPFAVHASSASDSLAQCLHSNASNADKETLIQWAFVTLGRTSAAKKVQPLKPSTITGVEAKAQKSLSTLVLQKCSKPAMQLLLTDPRNGLQDSLVNLAKRLVDDEIARRTSPLLNLGIGELLGR